MSPEGSDHSAPEEGGDARRIWRASVFGLCLIFVALLGEIWIEHSDFGQWMDRTVYDLIQRRLQSDESQVTVVDISKLKPVASKSFGYLITDRSALYDLIAAIVKEKPRSLGVDIDFSPTDGHSVDPGDPAFFQKCLDLSVASGIPIFLGVYRTRGGAPADWLGDGRFRGLAATIGIPRDGRHITAWLERTGSEGARLSSMGAALAQFKPSAPNPLLSWAFERISERKVDADYRVGESLVDFGPVLAIRDSAIRIDGPQEGGAAMENWPEIIGPVMDSHEASLKDRIVIIGDIDDPPGGGDGFVIPGPGSDTVTPGALVHACAANTLLSGPLCEITGPGRLVLDLLLSAGILGAMTAACLCAIHSDREVNISLLHGVLNGAAIAVVFLIGVVVVKTSRVIWNDFLLVIAVIALHRPGEHLAHRTIERARELWKAAFDHLFPVKKKEKAA